MYSHFIPYFNFILLSYPILHCCRLLSWAAPEGCSASIENCPLLPWPSFKCKSKTFVCVNIFPLISRGLRCLETRQQWNFELQQIILILRKLSLKSPTQIKSVLWTHEFFQAWLSYKFYHLWKSSKSVYKAAGFLDEDTRAVASFCLLDWGARTPHPGFSDPPYPDPPFAWPTPPSSSY